MGTAAHNQVGSGINDRMGKTVYVSPVIAQKDLIFPGDMLMVFPFRSTMKADNNDVALSIEPSNEISRSLDNR